MTTTMTPRQAFKFGFLLKCAELGLSEAEQHDYLDRALKLASGPAAAAWSLMKGIPMLGLATAGGLGAGAGYLAAKATEPEVDPEEFKQWELIAALRQHADHARRASQQLQLRGAPMSPRSPRLLS